MSYQKNSTDLQKANEGKTINPFVLMFGLLVVMTILTYIMPAGQYERTEVDGTTVVDPESFTFVERTPVGLLDMFNSFHYGLINGASIILFVLLFGSALGIMQATGAIDELIKYVTFKFGSKEKILVPVLVLIFGLLGTLIGSAEDALVYIAIIAPMMVSLRFDALTGFAIVMLGVMNVGFVSGITNPFSVGVAQTIAELPIYSGMGMRILLFAIFYVVTVLYIIRHAKKVKKDPSLGVYGHYEKQTEFKRDENYKMSMRHRLSLLVFLGTFIGLVFGVIQLGWYISEIAGIFLFGAVIMGIITKLKPSEMGESFVSGAKDMIAGAMIIGVAQAVLVVIQDGNLIDSFLYYSTLAVGNLPPILTAIGMFIMQFFINFFVNSGSGQAALTMPIMAPLGDLVDITRQTSVLAFQLGDGITNAIFPTSAVLLAGLGMMGIPYTRWVKWVLPFVLIQTVLAMIILVIAQLIHYS